jgi:hypothetical protein
MAISKEEQLYEPVKAYFTAKGYDVKSEVNHCDLVGVHHGSGEVIVVEMKKTFNLALLLQGVERLRLGANVYLAIERNRKKSGAVNQRYSDLAELCRRLGVGLLTVTFYVTKSPVVELLCSPDDQPVRSNRPSKGKRLLYEFKERSGDYNVGGSHARKLVTAYRERALRCASALAQLEQASPAQLSKLTGVRNVGSILRDNHYHWFNKLSRGLYGITDEGRAALQHYEAVIAGWSKS